MKFARLGSKYLVSRGNRAQAVMPVFCVLSIAPQKADSMFSFFYSQMPVIPFVHFLRITGFEKNSAQTGHSTHSKLFLRNMFRYVELCCWFVYYELLGYLMFCNIIFGFIERGGNGHGKPRTAK